jgi:hypothetical protein
VRGPPVAWPLSKFLAAARAREQVQSRFATRPTLKFSRY